MRILIATGVYPPESGGPATYTKLLEERLPARGFSVVVLPFRTVRHYPKVLRHLAYFYRCYRMAKNADLVYAQDTVSVGLPSALAAFLAHRHFMVRIPGDYAWEQGSQRFGAVVSIEEFQGKYFGVRVALLRTIQRFVVRRAYPAVAPSEYLRTLALGWGAKPQRVVRIYNGIAFPVPTEAPRHRPQGFLVVSVGRLVPWKGMDGLIRVIAKESAWRLVLVGDGPGRGELEALAEQLRCGDRVVFAGAVPRPEALGWVKEADAFVLNSSYEGLSHQLIEAMSLRVPIVATQIGGNPELIRDGREGILIPAHDDAALHAAIKSIERDSEGASALAQAAELRSREFSIEHTLAKLTALLKRL